jgi:hypothetical protein
LKQTFLLAGICAGLLLVIAVFGVSTGAWFSTTSYAPGSIIVSGTLDLAISGGPLFAQKLAPGEAYTEMGTFCVQNSGTLPLKYRGQFLAAEGSARGLLSYSNLKVERQTSAGWEIIQDLGGTQLPGYFIFPGLDQLFRHPDIVDGTLTPSAQHCYRLWVKLDGMTPNEFQNAEMNFALVLHATQINAPD